MVVLAQSPSGLDRLVTSINDPINAFAWGWPTILLISFTGILLMVGLGFMPILRLPYGVRMMLSKPDQTGEGDITPFQALMTSLAATVGTGNIAGVASAIAIGGPGAVFWMWLIAFFGIATKYAEAVLAVHYREVDELGNHVGGPMYYIRNGLGPDGSGSGVCSPCSGCLPASASATVCSVSRCPVPCLVSGFRVNSRPWCSACWCLQ